MPTVNASVVPIKELLNQQNFAYIIPDYQRPSTWDQDRIESFLNAILEDCKKWKFGASTQTITFLGSMIFYGPIPPSFPGQSSKIPDTLYHIVDGQQRLTMLVLLAFCMVHLDPNLVFPNKEWYSTSRNRHSSYYPPVPKLIRQEDDFNTSMTSELGQLLETCISSPNTVIQHIASKNSKLLLNGYEKMLQIIFNWINKEFPSNSLLTLDDYGNYLAQNCQIVRIIVDDPDVAFEIFEPMNSTSDPLTPFEIFKAQLAQLAKKQSLHFNFQDCDNLLKPLYDERKRDSIQRLSNDLIFYSAQVFDGQQLSQRFLPLKQYLDRKVAATQRLEDFISVLEAGARVLQAWNNGGQLNFANIGHQRTFYQTDPAHLIQCLSNNKHNIAILPIQRYEYQAVPQDLTEIVKAIAAFYALWRAVSTTNRLPEVYRNLFNTTNNLNPIIGSMRVNGGNLLSIDKYIEYFRARLSNELNIRKLSSPTYTIFDLWYHNVNLNYNDVKKLCHLFLYIDQLYTLKPHAIQPLSWITDRDIDHIMPSGQAGSDEIGNLTILNPSINRSIQDMCWDPDKRAIYAYLAQTSRSQPQPNLPSGAKWPTLVNPNIGSFFYLQDILVISAQYNGQWNNDTIAIRSALIKARAWKVLYCDWLQGDQTDPASCQRASELLSDWTNVTEKTMDMAQFKEKWIRLLNVQEPSAEAE